MEPLNTMRIAALVEIGGKMKKWILMGWVGAMAAGSLARPPNVVFILVDDLGWRDTGCYGSSFYETPNVDRLAKTGLRFTDAYSANPLCSPTRSSILTGQYPARTGFTGASGHIRADQDHVERFSSAPDERAAGPLSVNHLALEYYTLGKAMKDAGYATAFLGKWHMGYDPYIPENHGFDFVVGGREHPGPPGTDPNRKFYPPWSGDTLQPNPPADTHIDDYLGEKAVAFINEHKDEPFFMCFWLYDVHAPFQSKPELIEKWRQHVDPGNPQHCPTMAAMIEVMDDNVGRLLDALEANGIDDGTIVIFTSDNGGNMYDVADDTTPTNNDPLRSGKGNNYEGGVRVPLIVRWPGMGQAGKTSSAVVSTVDHYPSILEMTGQPLRPQDHKDGVSYVPVLKGEAFERGPILCDFTHFVPATMNIPNSSLRYKDWKLYRFWFDGSEQKDRYELYNLKDDIAETRNLAGQHSQEVEKLAEKMDAIRTDVGALAVHPNTNYNGRTVGVWAANPNGNASAQDDALIMQAHKNQFALRTRVTPSLMDNAVFEFEARSATGTPLAVQWTSSEHPGFGEPQIKEVSLSKGWKRVKLDMSFPGRISEIRFLLTKAGSAANVRNVRLSTPDGSLMTEYEFY